MAVNPINFTTGPATLPDVGILRYNGCLFSPLFETNMSGKVVQDNANRTTKSIEYTLTVDGYVTLPDGDGSTGPTMSRLRELLTAQAGVLEYTGRGLDLIVSGQNVLGVLGVRGATRSDVAWGPIPELIEFQPLGGGRSAKVVWKVVARVVEYPTKGSLFPTGILQFNYDTTLRYGEDGFSTLIIKGTAEIPMTRRTIGERNIERTVDDIRTGIVNRFISGIDLARFRVTNREFNVSRDKRTMEWSFQVEEKPYMDLPVFCTIARGSYNVRPVKQGPGLVSWLCTLRATYTIRWDIGRRSAWHAFLGLLRVRMNSSEDGVADPNIQQVAANPRPPPDRGGFIGGVVSFLENPLRFTLRLGREGREAFRVPRQNRKAWLINFSIDEGLYLDSKTISFSATWRLVTIFSHILLGSGVWKKYREEFADGTNLWAHTMAGIQGDQSWLRNRVDPNLDVIIDFGGP